VCARDRPTDAERPGNIDRPLDALLAEAYSAPTNPSMGQVGAQFGISRERVRQRIDRWERENGQLLTRSPSRRKKARLAAIEEARIAPPCLEQVLLNGAELDAATGCWLWVARTHRVRGRVYPVLCFGGKAELANRVAYQLWCGDLIARELVLTTCGALCINPAHLHKLSRAEHMRTHVRKGQPHPAQSHCKQGHALTLDNVVLNPGWRLLNGERVRVHTRLCKICNGVRQARSTGRPKPSPSPPAPLPEDPLERDLEVAIRRVVHARKSVQVEVLERQISLHGTLWDRELGAPTCGEERYQDYNRRTRAGRPSWFTWRLALSERIALSCASFPALQAIIQRAERRGLLDSALGTSVDLQRFPAQKTHPVCLPAMSRHNRMGSGTDQTGTVFSIEYPPDWLDKVKITRPREGGRQSTMTLFRNPDHPSDHEDREGRVRLRVSSEGAGIEFHLTLTPSIRRAAVEVELPVADGEPPQPLTFTFYAFA
jgi:hypothetical protein